MPLLSQPYDVWEFSGDEETYSTLATTDPVTGNSVDGKHLTTLGATDHGFKAGSLVYIQGTINYNGLKLIQAVAANTITIYAKFIAEATVDTSDTIKTMVTYDRITGKYSDAGVTVAAGPPFEFLGFTLHLNAAASTAAETFVINIDANKGAAWDRKVYSKDMNGVQDIDYFFDEPKKCESGDKVDVVWNNADDALWGIKLYTRRLV